MPDRKSVFDAVRRMLGRGFKQSEVAALDAALDAAFNETGADMAGVKPDLTLDWIALASPLIERFEGMARLVPGGMVEAYPDPGTGGAPWTIGIGSTTDEFGKPIAPGTKWTVERARARFEAHLREFGEAVDKALDGAPATPAQKAAMTSLCYNAGSAAFARSSVLRFHKAGQLPQAADAFLMWVKSGGKVMKGLQRRRAAERELYLS